RLRDAYRAAIDGLPDDVVRDDAVFQPLRTRFAAAMNDDLNTPQAIAVLFDAAREVHKAVDEGASDGYRAGAVALFDELLDGVLGIPAADDRAGVPGDLLDGVVALLLAERQRARDRRDFAQADAI